MIRFVCLSLFLSCFFSVQIVKSESTLSEEQCLDLGFNRLETDCAKCDYFGQFDLLEGQVNCQKCCTADTASEDKPRRYPKARLEMCNCKREAYPQISAFISGKASKSMKGFVSRHVDYAEPVLKLLDEKNNVIKTLSIQKWTTDQVEAFLKERLVEFA